MGTKMGSTNRLLVRWLACTALASVLVNVTPASATGLTPLGQPFNIDLFDPAGGTTETQPAVALAADGSGVSAWTVWNGSTGYTYIVARRFAADGTPLGSDIVVDAGPGAAIHDTSPLVASDAAGNFVVAWYDSMAGNPSYRLFAADGTPRTAAACIAADCGPSVVYDLSMDNAGDFAVLLAPFLKPATYFFHADGSAGPVQPVPLVGVTSWTSAALSMNRQNGNVNVVWMQEELLKSSHFFSSTDYESFMQRYNADGSPVGSAITVVNCVRYRYFYYTPLYYGCDTSAISIAQDDSGNSLVVWGEDDLKNGGAETFYIYARGFTSSGGSGSGGKVKVSPPPSVTNNVSGAPTVKSATPTVFVVAWNNLDYSDPANYVYSSTAQTVGLNGLLFGSAVQFPASSTTPGVAANSSGNVITVWPSATNDPAPLFGIVGQFYLQQ